MSARPPDWTSGVPRLVVTSCEDCRTSWYLPHEHCPACGSRRHRAADAAGTGMCVAVTRVHGAAGGADDGPLGLALTELDEGVLVLGRTGGPLRPGDRVRVDLRPTSAGMLAPTVRRIG